MSMVLVGVVTTMIIMTISSNIILSLGMVGALSIVRFRTAVKDSIDIAFMFWSIATGIAVGALFYQLAIVSTIFISIIILLMINFRTFTNPYLLVINYDAEKVNNISNK